MSRSQRALQIGTFLGIFVLACYSTSQETENRRAVTEHQFMHDKGRAIQGLKRLMWLHNAMGGVHTANSRDLSHSNAWDLPKRKDIPWPEFHNGPNSEETQDLMKQLIARQLEEEQRFPWLKKNGSLQYATNPKYRWNLQEFADRFQGNENDRKQAMVSQAD